MRCIFRQIKAFQEPAKLMQTAARSGRFCIHRPGELIGLQTLLPQTKSIAVPVQGFELGVASVGEDVQRAGKGGQAQFLLNECA